MLTCVYHSSSLPLAKTCLLKVNRDTKKVIVSKFFEGKGGKVKVEILPPSTSSRSSSPTAEEDDDVEDEDDEEDDEDDDGNNDSEPALVSIHKSHLNQRKCSICSSKKRDL